MDPRHPPIALSPPPWYRSAQAIVSIAATVGWVVWLLLLAGCGGGSAAAPDTGTSNLPGPVEKTSLQASQPGELLAYARAKLAERQKLRAQSASNNIDFAATGDLVATAAGGPVFSAGSGSPPLERSSTAVQEEGVDEDDLIKSDGSIIYTLGREQSSAAGQAAAKVSINRLRSDGSTELASRLTLNADPDTFGFYSGIYLVNKQPRLAVLGSMQRSTELNFCSPAPTCASAALLPFPRYMRPTVAIDMVNAADASRAVVTDKLRIDGSLVGSRLIGNSLVLVTQFTPRLAADALPWNASATEREAATARLAASELLPTVSVNNGPSQPLMAETDCYVEPKNASYGLEVTSITVIDLSSASLTRSSRCFIGGSEALYMSTTALFLATTSYPIQPLTPMNGNTRLVFPPQITTDVHKFALTPGIAGGSATIDYRGSGTVPGHLGWSTQQRSYRLSEYNGDLRVLTFTGQAGWGVVTDATNAQAPAPSPATLSVLRESSAGKSLQTVGQLPNAQRPQAIGKPGEQVYAVRFIGDRGYVVTFRRVDPLYVLDLSKAEDPKTSGELTVAGFTDHLFPVGPVGSGLLLGVGKDTTDRGVVTGVKVALFDVADPRKPTQKFTTTFGTSGQSALDYSRHGIDLFTRGDQTRVVLPVVAYQSGVGLAAASFALQRFEVNATARTITLISPVVISTDLAREYPDLGQARTLQIGEKLYHFDGEELNTYGW